MLSNFCSKILTFLGVHPDYPLGKFRIAFNNAVALWAYILGGVTLYKERSPETIETICIIAMMHTIYLVYIFGKSNLKQLLADANYFWEAQVEDEEISYILLYFERVVKIFKVLLYTGVVSCISKPFILNEMTMYKFYKPAQIPFLICCTMEYFLLAFTAACYISSNIIICSLIIESIIQFRGLNLSIKALNFSNLDIDSCTSEMKRLIEYHQFLIRHVEDLNKLLSIPFAISIIVGTASLCLEMYLLTSNIESTLVMCRVAVLCSSLICQFFTVYGLPAQILMEQFTAMADIIYFELDWYLPHVIPLRRSLLVMITRSQKEVCIKAAGYHTANNQTILVMMKTAYSFYTFLQTVS